MKDVTNNLESGPIDFKAMWNGLRVGLCVAVREGAASKNKAQENKAQIDVNGTMKANGSGLKTGTSNTRLPDPNRARDKVEALNQPQEGTDRRGKGDHVQIEARSDRTKMDDMLDGEQDGGAADHAGN